MVLTNTAISPDLTFEYFGHNFSGAVSKKKLITRFKYDSGPLFQHIFYSMKPFSSASSTHLMLDLLTNSPFSSDVVLSRHRGVVRGFIFSTFWDILRSVKVAKQMRCKKHLNAVRLSRWFEMGVSKNSGIPKLMVYNGKPY